MRRITDLSNSQTRNRFANPKARKMIREWAASFRNMKRQKEIGRGQEKVQSASYQGGIFYTWKLKK